MSKQQSSSSPSLPLLVAASIGTALLLRAVKRSFSPEITCKLSCQCGKIQGQVVAKREDSIRIHCHCSDCRMYAAFVASLSNNKTRDSYWGKDYVQVVQVCKSAIKISKGEQYLKLVHSTSQQGATHFHASILC